jgi:hypothetical protein
VSEEEGWRCEAPIDSARCCEFRAVQGGARRCGWRCEALCKEVRYCAEILR